MGATRKPTLPRDEMTDTESSWWIQQSRLVTTVAAGLIAAGL